MTDDSVPFAPGPTIEPRFIPTIAELRALWLDRTYANVPEKIEYEVGFEFWASTLGNSRARPAGGDRRSPKS